jgi:acetyl esterase/lipase
MIRIVCRVSAQTDHVSFSWSDGVGWFEPYHLKGLCAVNFWKFAQDARARLSDLVWDHVEAPTAVPASAFALAQVGYNLYRQIFSPDADQLRVAEDVRGWLDKLRDQVAIESVEVVLEAGSAVPWNVVYDRKPEEQAFAVNAGSSCWEPFWGIRYNLAGGRRVNPLRRMPHLENPRTLMVLDPGVRAALPAPQQQALDAFTGAPGVSVAESREMLQTALRMSCPDLMYWLCHATPDALLLGEEKISPADLYDLLRGDDLAAPRRLGGLAFFNACRTAEEGNASSFLDAMHSFGMSGVVVTEHKTLDTFANEQGLLFLTGFLQGGKPLGTLLHELRRQVPLGLLYAANCPPHIRVRRLPETPSQPPGGGPVLTVPRAPGQFLAASGTRGAPALPEQPYRPLVYYDQEYRALFVGRDNDVHRFSEMLDDPATRLVVLHGESGVGKSSFLRAEFIPYLEEECVGYRFLRPASKAVGRSPVLFIRSTHDPISQLAQALCAYCAQPYSFPQPTGGLATVDLPGRLAQFLGKAPGPDALRAALCAEPRRLGSLLANLAEDLPFALVLVIDQGEEMFTLSRTEEDIRGRRLALEMFRQLAEAPGEFKVILSMRTEYYGQMIDRLNLGPEGGPRFPAYLLTTPSEADLIEAIRRPTTDGPIPYSSEVPAEKYRFAYAEGVPQAIVRQVQAVAAERQDGVLPLLQVVCAQLYEAVRQRPGGVIGMADLKRLAPDQASIRRYVESLLIGVVGGRAADGKALQRLLTRLYLRQPGGNLTTALVPEADLARQWTGSMPFEQVLRSAEKIGLLRVDGVQAPGQGACRCISLGHDMLARVATKWYEHFACAAPFWQKATVAGAGAAALSLAAVLILVRWEHGSQAEIQRLQGLQQGDQAEVNRLQGQVKDLEVAAKAEEKRHQEDQAEVNRLQGQVKVLQKDVLLTEARSGFETKIKFKGPESEAAPEPPKDSTFRKVEYDSKVGKLAAYLSHIPMDGKKHPAIIWVMGGDCNTIDSGCWRERTPENDQSVSAFRKAGIVTMFPSLRGGNKDQGFKEAFFGEVDDVVSAAGYLAKQEFVDPQRIYMGGHSTGGTLALLVAESSDRFRAVFSFGPVDEVTYPSYTELFPGLKHADPREIELRSPRRWLQAIQVPTFIFEGKKRGNLYSLEMMNRGYPRVHAYPVSGADHFSILAPTTKLIADKIRRDDGPATNLTFTEEELNKLFAK